MKKIKLNNSDLCAIVDDEDFDEINHHDWYLHLGRAKSVKPINDKRIYLHQYLLLNKINENKSKIFIKHKDKNLLNCTRSNLIIITAEEKTRQSNNRLNKTSKYRGVSFDSKSNGWRASITINKKLYNLGTYDSEEEAYRIYKEYKDKY